MCGLVGYFGKWQNNRENTFYDMLQVDVIRGPHSTGVAFVKHNEKFSTIVKEVGSPGGLFKKKEFKDAAQGIAHAYLGHNRFATKGAINIENAHPFEFDHVIGMHNGTVNDINRLPDNKHNTDSKAIISSIAKAGIDETWSKLNGAAALVWWDAKEKSLNMIRNNHRPLAYAYTKDHDGVFFASESWMINGCAYRNKVEIDQAWIPNINILAVFKEEGGKVVDTTRRLDPFTFPKKLIRSNFPGLTGINNHLSRKERKKLRKLDLNKRGRSVWSRETNTWSYIDAEKEEEDEKELDIKCIWCGQDVDDDVVELDDNLYACRDCENVALSYGMKKNNGAI